MNLDVLIPSLLLPAPIHAMFPPPTVPALERLLARADRRLERAQAVLPWLCERWGIASPYPFAPLLAEYDRLETSGSGWMFAEPVHLIAHRDRFEMLPARHLELSTGEASDLVTLLNSHFADRQLQFFAPTPDRWYVGCSASEIPETTPPYAAHGGSLTDFLPISSGAMNWRALQNEAQMLFFGHAVNEAREAVGKPAVSGVWFWGGGVYPALKQPSYSCVIANPAGDLLIGQLAAQLAAKCGIEVRDLSWDSIPSGRGDVLAVIDSCADFAARADIPGWARELDRLDREWFEPMARALANGILKRVSIQIPGGGSVSSRSFHLTRHDQLLRFWRAANPLSSHA